MGIYYSAVDRHEKKFFEAPDSYEIKSPGCFAPGNPFPNMVVMKNARGWNFEIEMEFFDTEGFEEITEEVYKELLSIWPNFHKCHNWVMIDE